MPHMLAWYGGGGGGLCNAALYRLTDASASARSERAVLEVDPRRSFGTAVDICTRAMGKTQARGCETRRRSRGASE
eukprot:3364730-Pleurochrysis_carterae.AAC.1